MRWHGFFDTRSPLFRLRYSLWWIHQNWLWLWPSASWCPICESWSTHLATDHSFAEHVACMVKAVERMRASIVLGLIPSLRWCTQGLNDLAKAMQKEEHV